MPKKSKIPEDLKVDEIQKEGSIIANHGFKYVWCCDCGLRHVYQAEIIRGRESADDFVVLKIGRDDWATEARKMLKKKGINI